MPLDQLIPGLIGTTLCLTGTVVFARLALLGLASRRWTQVEGEVVHSVVVHQRGKGNSKNHRANIQYRFGATTGRRVYFGDFIDASQAVAETLVKRYPLGAKVTVWHAPGNPGQSCLEHKIDVRVWIFLVFLAGMTASIAFALLGNGSAAGS